MNFDHPASNRFRSFFYATVILIPIPCWSEAITPAPPELQSVPTQPQQKESETLIRDLFKIEFSNNTPEAKLALAKKLLEQGIDTKDDPNARFVLLRESRDLARDSGNVEQAVKAIQSLAKWYQIDELGMKKEVLDGIAKKAGSAETALALGEQYLSLCDDAVQVDDFTTAQTSIRAAQNMARMAKNLPLIAKSNTAQEHVRTIQSRYNLVRSSMNKLKQDANDPNANYEVGQYKCFEKGDWTGGIPLLAKSSNEALRMVAQKELKNPTEGMDLMALAEGWWTLSQKETKESGRAPLRTRAEFWCQMAIKALTGLSQTKAQKLFIEMRLEQGPQKMYLSDMKHCAFKSGYGELGLNGSLGYEELKVEIDGAKLTHSISFAPPASNFACVEYHLGMRYRKVSGSVRLNDGLRSDAGSPLTFKIMSGDNVLWTSKPIQKPKDTDSFQVDITGVDVLHLRIEAQGTNAFSRTVWVEPVISK